MEQITADAVVTICYQLRDQYDILLETIPADRALTYIHGRGVVLPAMEEQLEGLRAGDEFDFELPPEQAYGPYLDRLTQHVPRESFPPEAELKVGAQLRFKVGEGDLARTLRFVVKKVGPQKVVLDGNRPLAGKTLHFAGRVLAIRAPSPEELDAAQRGEF